jgi:hypothetical protein
MEANLINKESEKINIGKFILGIIIIFIFAPLYFFIGTLALFNFILTALAMGGIHPIIPLIIFIIFPFAINFIIIKYFVKDSSIKKGLKLGYIILFFFMFYPIYSLVLSPYLASKNYDLALEQNNPDLCAKLKNSGPRVNCYNEVALELKDSSICDRIEEDNEYLITNKNKCYSQVAYELGDANICEKIKTSGKELCLKSVSFKE